MARKPRPSLFGAEDPLGGIFPTSAEPAAPAGLRAVRSPGPAKPAPLERPVRTPPPAAVPAVVPTARLSVTMSVELDARIRAWAAHHGAGNLLSAFLEDVLQRAVTDAEKKNGGPFPPPLFRRKPRTPSPR